MLLSQDELTRILPQTYPFLMIDQITEIKKGERLTAIKNITGSEWIFQNQPFQLNHLPEPFIIEAAAQAALVLYHLNKIKDFTIKPKYTLGKIFVQLHDYWCIGDQLVIHAFATKMLDVGGYSEIVLYRNNESLVKNTIKIFYSVAII